MPPCRTWNGPSSKPVMSQMCACYHCGSEITTASPEIFAQAKTPVAVCCLGCKAITEHIFQTGLSSYYDYRSDLANKPPEDLDDSQYRVYEDAAVINLVANNMGASKFHLVLSVDNIHCAACAWLIEQSLAKLDGIESVNVNTVNQRADIKWDQERTSLSTILSLLHEIGYPSQPFKVCDTESQLKAQEKQFIKRLGVAGLFTMQVMMLAVAMYYGAFGNMESHQTAYFKWISMGLSLPVIFYSALPFLHGAITSLKSRRLNMDVPVSLAIYGAFFISLYQLISYGLDGKRGEVFFESISMFTFLLLIGKYMEFKAKSRAVLSNANLNSNLPLTANKYVDGEITTLLVNELAVGDEIVIKPGEHISVDGRVINGMTSVNESVLNGEFSPQSKGSGDAIYAGSINADGTVRMVVTALGEQTTLSKIATMQAEFAQHKPKFSLFADKIAHWFVFSQLILAFVTYLYWYFASPQDAVWIALSVLVATCPCALSLATPTAYTCVMSALNRAGILVKDPTAFDKLPLQTEAVFDKTGTLTRGRFTITETELSDNCTPDILRALVQLQSHSEHPIAKAFTSESLQIENTEAVTIESVRIHVGQGLSCVYRGKELRIGCSGFCVLGKQGAFNVFLLYGEEHLASFTVSDEIKAEATEVIAKLKQSGLLTTILSGDSSQQVEQVAAQLNVQNHLKGCKPKEKVNYIRTRQSKDNSVMMIGDGINDAPVFAVADVSIAMGNGADISKFGADVIVLNNNLSAVITLLTAAKKTNSIIKRNLYWSLIYNLVILPVAMMGYVAPYIAVIGMSVSSILVVTNSLKLLKIDS